MVEIKEDILQNFVDLQDVLSNLAIKIDDLTQHISKLLRLFEESAKSMQEAEPETQQNKEFYQTVKTLLDQNKIIAKGISIVEERLRNQQPQQMQPQYYQPPQFQPQQAIQQPQQLVRPTQLAMSQKMTPSLIPPKPSSDNMASSDNITDRKQKIKPLPNENEQQ